MRNGNEEMRNRNEEMRNGNEERSLTLQRFCQGSLTILSAIPLVYQ